MTLYTVMPEELVWQSGDMDELHSTIEIQMSGLLMQVQPMDKNQAKIVRLLNCELTDYLNPQYAPGSIISFVPVVEQKKAEV